MDRNQAWFDHRFDDPVRADLYPHELAVVDRFHRSWADWDVLELGCGDGRVAATLGAISRSYLGIDYAPSKVAEATARFSPPGRRRFQLGDARRLPAELAAGFDAVWLVFNGLDYVAPQERDQVLGEVARVLRPGGHFYLNCHSLAALPFVWEWPTLRPVRPHRLADAVQMMYDNVMLTRRSRSADLTQARRRGWGVFRGPGDFTTFYADPAWQVGRLETAGFDVVGVYDGGGRSIDPRAPGRDESVSYLARLRPAAGPGSESGRG